LNNTNWIPLEKIQNFLQLEIYIVALIAFFLGYFFYLFFLKKISEKRHKNLRGRLKQIPPYFILSSILSLSQYYLTLNYSEDFLILKISGYLSLVALILGTVALIKISQIYAYLYLFFSNMSHGVPKLLANMFTFIVSIIFINLIASSIFNIHLTALLATSAVFSLVLGLALQDTLGNFFSGISLQIESPFKIGDWIEVNLESEKWLGQVQEISWRATFLLSFSDELIMIPNRTIASGRIIIISQGNKNIRLNQTFRFGYDVDIKKAKESILKGISRVEGIMTDPPIRILITETKESWLTIQVFYSLVDFSTRWRKGDEILESIISEINNSGIKLQSHKLEIEKPS